MNLKLIVVLKKVYGSKDMNEIKLCLSCVPKVKEYLKIDGREYCIIKVTYCYNTDDIGHVELLVSEII